jgi:hypothetical protein
MQQVPFRLRPEGNPRPAVLSTSETIASSPTGLVRSSDEPTIAFAAEHSRGLDAGSRSPVAEALVSLARPGK